ncbi:FecCD family ABC transporter permease [Butyrivibrio sp. LC3010]|uniref:FecCD family ABC transporter permease n=1 Tax=Butyrivibrio sp. LC3010 TaxID=1280680 RepID=UPI000406223A|nr:iron ABC transporter permease [Butyrivibrio sp. LC3010]
MNTKKIGTIYILGIILIFISMALSITYGTKSVGLSDVIDAVLSRNTESFNVNVVQARIPRTIFGVIAGASLAISGVLMQTITRNPIADPSILGVNTGASLFIVIGIAFFNIQSKLSYMGLSFAGAMITALIVYKLASSGYSGPTPIKLAIAGSAASIALSSIISIVLMPDSSVMTTYRFWQIGSIGGTGFDDILLILPIFLISVIVSLLSSDNLNILLLAEESAVSLGLNINRVRLMAALCGVLLCASTTALAGPIAFVGLMVPHFIRMVVGSDHKHLITCSGLYGSCVLILSDVAGRILGRPGELESGIITALLGAPVFIFIIRKARIQSL